MQYSKVAIVLWEQDYDELKGKYEPEFGSLDERFDEVGTFTTPDETYVCLYADWGPWYDWGDITPEVSFIMDYVRSVRHSFIKIPEDASPEM